MRVDIRVKIQGSTERVTFPKTVATTPVVGHRIASLETSSGGGVGCYLIKEVVHGWDHQTKKPVVFLLVSPKERKIIKL